MSFRRTTPPFSKGKGKITMGFVSNADLRTPFGVIGLPNDGVDDWVDVPFMESGDLRESTEGEFDSSIPGGEFDRTSSMRSAFGDDDSVHASGSQGSTLTRSSSFCT